MSKPLSQASVYESFEILMRECRPRRLIQEDPGVKGPLWFGRDPDSPWHVPMNILRIIWAIPLAPLYFLFPKFLKESLKGLLKGLVWTIEWFHVPDAILLEPPGAGKSANQERSSGKYAVTGNKPRWLLEVHFQGERIISQRQVPYDGGHYDESTLLPEGLALRGLIQRYGYTAISYPMKSAKVLFQETGKELGEESETEREAGRELSLRNRKLISQTVLDCYAQARTTMPGVGDGVEYIWLDEFCLADDRLSEEINKAEIDRQRKLEVGLLADIFRSAKRVVVFCHELGCDHTGIECLWGKRLFTMGEILYTPEVLQMTRSVGPEGELVSSIVVLSGPEFRGCMQARAAQAEKWHLYNIMQHSTNAGSATWQSAIHSLVVEAVRRDEAEGYHYHNMLGKALNGLLPRRSRPEDLEGIDGWADLAWLLELNQGFYNAVLLAAVCKTADPWVKEYRWWGKPIAPCEGHERLEPLATAIPVKFRNEAKKTVEPVLSIVAPKSLKLTHMLRRDPAALYRNEDMRSLKVFALWLLVGFYVLGFSVLVGARSIGGIIGGLLVWYFGAVFLATLELLVGTIYVKKDGWIVFDGDKDPIPFLQSRDPDYTKSVEWGARQLIPTWDEPDSHGKNPPGKPPYLRTIILVDLKTGVSTKAVVTGRPNNMVALAVHGSGVTCMLLDRNKDALEATVSVKVGMVNVPPFVLAQAHTSGTVYVGGGAIRNGPVTLSSATIVKEKSTGDASPPMPLVSYAPPVSHGVSSTPSTTPSVSEPGLSPAPRTMDFNNVIGAIPSGAAIPANTRGQSSGCPVASDEFNPYREGNENTV